MRSSDSPRKDGASGEARLPRSPGEKIVVQVNRGGEGWEVVLPGNRLPISCETFEDARRVAFLCGAHTQPCELVVHDGRDRVRRELIGVSRQVQ